MGLFGIGDGKMELQLPKTEYTSGEKMTGTAILTLNKDVKGKGVIVEIWGERVETTRMMNGQIQRKNVIVYKFAANLDQERTYLRSESPKSYSFTLDIPEVGTSTQASGVVGKMFSALTASGLGNGPIMWFVEAKLLMPMLELAIGRKQQISVVGRAGSASIIQ